MARRLAVPWALAGGRALALSAALLAGCATSTPAPGAPGPSGPGAEPLGDPRPFDGPVPAACSGARIDLGALSACACTGVKVVSRDGAPLPLAGGWCGPDHEGAELPPGIEVALTAADPIVRPDATTHLTFAIRNTTPRERAVVVTDRHLARHLVVVDPGGDVVETTGACGAAISSTSREHLVVLAAGGEAKASIPWRASGLHGERRDDDCVLTHRPLAPGHHELRMEAPLRGSPIVRAVVEVRGTAEPPGTHRRSR